MAHSTLHWWACGQSGYFPSAEARMARDLGRACTFDATTVIENLACWAPNTLAEILARANVEYWNARPTTLTDPEYDRVTRRLKSLCPSHPQLGALGSEPQGRLV